MKCRLKYRQCIAAQNAVVAAESLGIGSCYIGDVIENAEQMREALHLPEHVIVENVHLSDSLMQLSYNIVRNKKQKKTATEKVL